MNYEDFWNTNGLDFITPKKINWPEGFPVGDRLRDRVGNRTVLEIGCGDGRLAGCFEPEKYQGLDINLKAVEAAKTKLRRYKFAHVGLTGSIKQSAEVVLLYTVCLHIPDKLLLHQLERFTEAATEMVIIAEIMNPNHRDIHIGDDEYELSNQRTPLDYKYVMEKLGWQLNDATAYPYKYYQEQGKNEFITFLVFTKTNQGE